MTTTSANKIEVSAADFAKMNKGLITVLKAIQKYGDDGIPTRKLLYDEIKMIGHGQHLIKHAYDLGYIKRDKVRPKGKGNWLMINRLSAKGKRLLSQLQ